MSFSVLFHRVQESLRNSTKRKIFANKKLESLLYLRHDYKRLQLDQVHLIKGYLIVVQGLQTNHLYQTFASGLKYEPKVRNFFFQDMIVAIRL